MTVVQGKPATRTSGRAVEHFEEISKGASLVHLAIAIGTNVLSQVVAETLEPYRKIGEIALLTLPLTAAAAIISAMVLRGSFAQLRGGERLYVFVPAILLPYLIAAAFGLVAPVVPVNSWWDVLRFFNPTVAPVLMVSVVSYYFSAYGFTRLVLSIICGFYLAWVWERKLRPLLRRDATS